MKKYKQYNNVAVDLDIFRFIVFWVLKILKLVSKTRPDQMVTKQVASQIHERVSDDVKATAALLRPSLFQAEVKLCGYPFSLCLM